MAEHFPVIVRNELLQPKSDLGSKPQALNTRSSQRLWKDHITDRLKERGVEKESGLHSTLRGRERSVVNQTNIGTVSRATLGRLLRDEAELVWDFPSATMPS